MVWCAGNFGVDICGEPVPDYNHRMTFNWTRDDITAQLAWRFIGAVDDDDPTFTYFVEEIDAIVDWVVDGRREGDVVLVMSNGAFGEIWEKLLGALEAVA